MGYTENLTQAAQSVVMSTGYGIKWPGLKFLPYYFQATYS